MIVKDHRGKYLVKAEDGHKLLGTYDTLAEAEARLRQVEMFKHMKPRGKK